MKCKNCGSEVMAFNQKCPKCGKPLDNEIVGTKEAFTSFKENNIEKSKKLNTISNCSSGISLVAIAIVIAGIVFAIFYFTKSETTIGVMMIVSTIILTSLLLGIANIIELLYSINNKLK